MDEEQLKRWASLIRHLVKGGSQSVLGKKVGVAASTVGDWMRGNSIPSYASMIKVAEAAGMTTQELIAYLEGSSSQELMCLDRILVAVNNLNLQDAAKINKIAANRVAELAVS